MQVLWTSPASQQFASAYEFVAVENPSAADRQIETIQRPVDRLADHPEMSRPGRIAGTRELVIQGTPYIAAYRVLDRAVQILALLHGARRWPTYL